MRIASPSSWFYVFAMLPDHRAHILEDNGIYMFAMLPEQDNGIYLFAMLPEHRAHILEDNERNCQFLSISCR